MKCPYCENEAVWCENKEIYGKNYGKSYMIWLCKPCRAYVGCHNNSQVPLGTMANAEIRERRKEAHLILDPIWKSGKMKRSDVYKWLNKRFGKEVHIGEADIEMCQKIILAALELTKKI